MEDGKVEQAFRIQPGHLEWLREMAEKYDLDDVDKAVRVVLEYALQDGDEETIFGEVRCHHCG